MLKRIMFLFVLCFFICINSVPAGESEKHLVILYNSDTKSTLESCGCKNATGGLALRAGLVKELRGKNSSVILLDGGDSISAGRDLPALRADISMKALGLMKYDGLNIADGELGLGLKFFEQLREKTKIPLLSANIYKNKKPLGQEYLIKQVVGVKVGVIGLVSPGYFNAEILAKENLEVKDPQTVLKEILPGVKSQANIIVLLSHLGKKETAALVQKVSGIDVAIVGHESGMLNKPESYNKTIVVQNNMLGKFLGILDLTIGEKGGIEKFSGSVATLNKETPVDSEVDALVGELERTKSPAGPDPKANLPQ